MADRQQRVYVFSLITVACIAAILRIGSILALGSTSKAIETSYEHREIVRNLCDGKGFSMRFFGPAGQALPTSQQAPLVPYVLAGAWVLFGEESPTAIWAVLLVQVAISTGTVVLVGQIATRATGSRGAGLFAAGLASVSPALVASPSHLQALVWNLGFLALAVLGTLEFRAGQRRLGLALFVPASILAWHSDPIVGGIAAALWVAMAVEAIWNERCLTARPVATVALMALLIGLGLVPWTIRNAVVHGRLTLIKDSFGYVFWQGNTAASDGTDKRSLSVEQRRSITQAPSIAAAARAAHKCRQQAVSVNATLPPEFVTHLTKLPTEIARMDAFGARIREELRRDPMQYADKCLIRLKQWVWFDETNPKSFLWPYRLSYLALVLGAIIGLWMTRDRVSGWAPLFVAALAMSAVHILIITSARFRVPLELLMIAPAGAALWGIAREARARYGSILAWARQAEPELRRPTST